MIYTQIVFVLSSSPNNNYLKGKILKIKLLLFFLIFTFCGVDTTVIGSNGSSPSLSSTTLTTKSQPKVTTKTTQKKQFPAIILQPLQLKL